MFEDYPEIEESIIDELCEHSKKLIKALEDKIQKLKQHIANLEHTKMSTKKNYRYSFLKNKEEA